ncbi:hypothetical protein FIBSPDRAFT_1038870 [Athelia psychrophila]|uniref:Uncharacterized protein n=1 Tax=Athelia psychrophila TaxID=1759441 RepID=A0A166SKL7_9AGAM|nr:hypothetical protein FIBSPDRAFT_1038870 [Fibularhizoctonia sp. CBS 109695]
MHARCPHSHPHHRPGLDTPLGRWLAPLMSIPSSSLGKTLNAPIDVLVEENVRMRLVNLTQGPGGAGRVRGRKTMLWTLGLVYKTEHGTLGRGSGMWPYVNPEAAKENN